MTKLLYYIGLLLLILYIISPFDAHPLLLDDLIASGFLLYLFYRNAVRKKAGGSAYTRYQREETGTEQSADTITLDRAYDLLGVSRDTSWEEIKKAYREKISGAHPDKVSHLDRELQEKADEVTRRINAALDIIRKSRGETAS